MIQISSIEELQQIGNNPAFPLDADYELTQDIDATDTVHWNGGAGFRPIGPSWNNPFRGKFDGKNYKIIGLYINRYNTDYIGLFGSIDVCGEVKNICLVNAIILGDWCVGGLAGDNGGTISNCYSIGAVSGHNDVGGLVGRNCAGTICGCYSNSSAFGINYIGGLAGVNYGTISNCYGTGAVSGHNDVGGLVGNNKGTATNSFAIGAVTGYNSNIGGLIGMLEKGNIINTYSTGLIEGGGYNKGGLIGYIDKNFYDPMVINSYWDIETSKKATSAGGEGKTTAQMKQLSTFIDWDFTNIWGIIENETYPYLLWQSKGE